MEDDSNLLVVRFSSDGHTEIECTNCGKDGYLPAELYDEYNQPGTQVICDPCYEREFL